MRTVAKVLLIGIAAYLIAAVLYAQSWRFRSLDLDTVTMDTFSFSDFSEEIWRNDQYTVTRSIRDTLLRFFPPGTDIKEFCDFFYRVGERELRKANSIEDQSQYLPTVEPFHYKASCSVAHHGELAIAQYNFYYRFLAMPLSPWSLWFSFSEGSYIFHIPLQDGKITDFPVTLSYRN